MRALRTFALVVLAASSIACSVHTLDAEAEKVQVSQNPPPAGCTRLDFLTGHSGGPLGGAFVPNDDLIDWAMDDLRNQAAQRGATYVQYDTPQMGDSDGTTTTVTITGTAHRCP